MMASWRRDQLRAPRPRKQGAAGMAFAVAPPKSGQDDDTPLFPRHNMAAFLLVTGLFFLWGIPNNLNDVLIRQFMKSFEITRLQAGVVQFSFFIGDFLFFISPVLALRRFGYNVGLLKGLLLYW